MLGEYMGGKSRTVKDYEIKLLSLSPLIIFPPLFPIDFLQLVSI